MNSGIEVLRQLADDLEEEARQVERMALENEQLHAEVERLRKALEGVATIAHSGGLANLTMYDAMDAIRRLTVGFWDKGRTNAETRAALGDGGKEKTK